MFRPYERMTMHSKITFDSTTRYWKYSIGEYRHCSYPFLVLFFLRESTIFSNTITAKGKFIAFLPIFLLFHATLAKAGLQGINFGDFLPLS